MSRKIEILWNRPDALQRHCVIPWTIQGDRLLKPVAKQEHIGWLYAERRKAMCKIVNDPMRLTGDLAPLRKRLVDAVAQIDTYISARCTTEKPNELAHLETSSE